MRHVLPSVLFSLLILAPAAYADELPPRPDDRVTFNLTVEDWVTTKTARTTINVEAAVSGANAGTMRADMAKAVDGLASGDWRLVSFDRNEDSTGLEHWSASYEARLPESALGGLGDKAKKLSKAGMQLSLANVDFSPTLDEVEADRAALRTQIYKKAADQLTALNNALPGRVYRIASIDFEGGNFPVPMRPMMAGASRAMPMAESATMSVAPSGSLAERSQKETLSARVVLAALPPAPEVKH